MDDKIIPKHQLEVSILPTISEPKKNNRFLVNFPKEFGIEQWCINSVNKPKVYNGKWDFLTITFRDPIVNSISKVFYDLLNTQASKDKFIFFEFNIQSLDPTGVVIEDWLVKVEKIISVDFGDLNYADSGIQMVTVTLKPGECELLDLKKVTMKKKIELEAKIN